MPVDIIAEIRQKLGSNSSLSKIDPNTQQPKQEQINTVENAAIPAVLAGIFKKTRNEEDAAKVLSSSGKDLIDIIFGEKTEGIVKSVASYSNTDEETAFSTIGNVADASKKVVSEHVKDINPKTLITFFTDQRSNILKHLPAELNIGELLNDQTMDDKTNKMEGPMSGLMHGIEKIFSSTK